MKVKFVDAENVGFKGLEAINTSIIDKVFVFSKVESIRTFCEQNLYLCLNKYPEGDNQADFYIIGYLSRVLSSLSKADKTALELTLYSSDKSLIQAFKFQCELLGANCKIVSFQQNERSETVKDIDVKGVDNKIFKMLKTPKGLFEIQSSLNVSKQEFTKAVNKLVKEEKIMRMTSTGKKWGHTPKK